MRRHYLVSYDIRDAKRLRRVFRVLKGYGEHWQYSVFFCRLKEIDRVRLQDDLEVEVNQSEDQVILIDLGANESTAREAIEVIGQRLPPHEENVVVI